MNASYPSLLLLLAVTFAYAGYNVFIKLSGSLVPSTATSTIVATICLQLAALVVSLCFYLMLAMRGGAVLSLSSGAYLWAVIAGICIGLAEIGYLYLFAGLGNQPPMAANLAIPVVVGGTILITMIFSLVFLREPAGLQQLIGGGLIIGGVIVLFLR